MPRRLRRSKRLRRSPSPPRTRYGPASQMDLSTADAEPEAQDRRKRARRSPTALPSPPPAIELGSNLESLHACEHPLPFSAPDAAKRAASSAAHHYRRAGYVEVDLGAGGAREAARAALPPVRAASAPPRENLLPLLRAAAAEAEEDDDLICVLLRLAAPETSSWKVPFVIIVAEQEETKRIRAGARKFQAHVYFGRLLFELVACEDVRVLFDALVPFREPRKLPVMPRRRIPCFQRSEGENDQFTFAGVLRRAESTGYPTLTGENYKRVREGLTVTLLEYQKQTVQWMLDKENSPHALNDYFWQTYYFPDSVNGGDEENSSAGERFYYFPLAGEARMEKPPDTRGGMICEEMGLGKTIEALAVIIAQKRKPVSVDFTVPRSEILQCNLRKDGTLYIPNRTQGNHRFSESEQRLKYGDRILNLKKYHSLTCDSDLVAVRRWAPETTLVVVPQSLSQQWVDEISDKAPGLTYAVWDSKKDRSDEDVIGPDAKDIVLTTYQQLRTDKIVTRYHWRRVILDEAQVVRRKKTAASREVCSLKADVRYMMSGTPITRSLSDIAGELTFLQIWPFTLHLDNFWETRVLNPFLTKKNTNLLDALLAVCMIRHSKAQGLGLSLPGREYERINVSLTGSHWAVYCFIWGCLVDELEHIRLETSRRPSSPSFSESSHLRRGDMTAARILYYQLTRVCLSAAVLDLGAIDFARRVMWTRLMMTSGSTRARWESLRGGDLIGTVSATAALRFVGELGTHRNRDSGRTHAVAADAASNSERGVHSAGFATLRSLIAGGAPPKCPVCLSDARPAVISKCAHFYCRSCALTLLLGDRPRCAICRRTLAAGGMVQVAGTTDEDEIQEAIEDGEIGTMGRGAWSQYLAVEPPEPIADHGWYPSLPAPFLAHAAHCQNVESPKLRALWKLITDAPNSKFVVFVDYIGSIVAHSYLQRRGVTCSDPCETLTASVGKFRRKNGPRVLVLGTRRASGLTLTCADVVVFLQPMMSAAEEQQAEARVHRLGQKSPVRVVRIVAKGSVDELLLERRASGCAGASEATMLDGVSDKAIREMFGMAGTETEVARAVADGIREGGRS